MACRWLLPKLSISGRSVSHFNPKICPSAKVGKTHKAGDFAIWRTSCWHLALPCELPEPWPAATWGSASKWIQTMEHLLIKSQACYWSSLANSALNDPCRSCIEWHVEIEYDKIHSNTPQCNRWLDNTCQNFNVGDAAHRTHLPRWLWLLLRLHDSGGVNDFRMKAFRTSTS